MGVLTAVHLVADNALCVLHRYAALCIGHPNYECNYKQERYNDTDYSKVLFKFSPVAPQSGKSLRTALNDTCKKQYRDTVTYTFNINLLAEPHNNGRTCRKGKHNNKRRKYNGTCTAYT